MTYVNIHPAGTASYPQLQVEWAPATPPPTFGTQTYVDITTRIREWGWSYGRNDELGESSPGSGYVVLDNRDRAFDPSYTAGTWYGNIKPRRAFRLMAKTLGSEYTVFVGYARGYPQEWPSDGADAVVRVDLVDVLAFLATFNLPIGFTRDAELSGARIDAVLDAIGWPDDSAYRAIDTGTVTVSAIAITDGGNSALNHMQQCAAAEYGQLYADRQILWFRDRRQRLRPQQTATGQYTFRDTATSGTIIRYDTTFVPTFDDTYLWNDIRVEGEDPDGTPGVAVGTASQAEFWTFSQLVSSNLAYEPDRTALAQYRLIRYQQPSLRVPTVTFEMGAQRSGTAQANILDLNPTVRVNLQRFYSGGTPMAMVGDVESISHRCRVGGPWHVDVTVSPADTTPYWTLQTLTLGTIDTTNLIAP